MTFLRNVLYFGWPNQPSSGIKRIYIGACAYTKSAYAITEMRKAKIIDGQYVKDKGNKIYVLKQKEKELVKVLREY